MGTLIAILLAVLGAFSQAAGSATGTRKKRTGKILREEVVFKDNSPKQDLPFKVGRLAIAGLLNLRQSATAIRQVAVIYRADTVTINWFLIQRYQPAKFEFVQDWGSDRKFRFPDGHLFGEPTTWFKNHTLRLILSFRGSTPRVFATRGNKILDVSNRSSDVQDTLDDTTEAAFLGELYARYPQLPQGLNFAQALLWTRSQAARDLAQHGVNLDRVLRLPLRVRNDVTKEPVLPRNKGIAYWANAHLGEYATKATRRAIMRLLVGGASPEAVVRLCQGLAAVAPYFDRSVWAEVLPLCQMAVNPNMQGHHIFEQLSQARRMRLMRQLPEMLEGGLLWVIADARHQYAPDIDVRGCRTWEELHDRLADEQRIRARDRQLRENRMIHEGVVDQTPYKGIDGQTVGGQLQLVGGEYQIVTPKRPAELLKWGKRLDHCIGSYALDAATSKHLFFALTQGDVLVYTGMIDPNRQVLKQLRGYKNSNLPPELFEDVVELLVGHGLLYSKHEAVEHFEQY